MEGVRGRSFERPRGRKRKKTRRRTRPRGKGRRGKNKASPYLDKPGLFRERLRPHERPVGGLPERRLRHERAERGLDLDGARVRGSSGSRSGGSRSGGERGRGSDGGVCPFRRRRGPALRGAARVGDLVLDGVVHPAPVLRSSRCGVLRNIRVFRSSSAAVDPLAGRFDVDGVARDVFRSARRRGRVGRGRALGARLEPVLEREGCHVRQLRDLVASGRGPGRGSFHGGGGGRRGRKGAGEGLGGGVLFWVGAREGGRGFEVLASEFEGGEVELPSKRSVPPPFPHRKEAASALRSIRAALCNASLSPCSRGRRA